MPVPTTKTLFEFDRLIGNDAYSLLNSRAEWLTSIEVASRRLTYGSNQAGQEDRFHFIKELATKLASPLVITLIIVAGFSYFFGEKISAIIVIIMALVGVILSFLQEFKAQKTAQKLQQLVHISTTVIRDGKKLKIPFLRGL
jgi:magnesium-transporting ATPase (P-type)